MITFTEAMNEQILDEADDLFPLFDTIASGEWDMLAAASWPQVAKKTGTSVDDSIARGDYLNALVQECGRRSDAARREEALNDRAKK